MNRRLEGLLAARIPYAFALALLLVSGTLLGGALYEAANPAFERIVWLEHDGAAADGNLAIRRALFADGRFLALTSDGYRAGLMSHAETDEIFAAVRQSADSWLTSYDTPGVVGERIELKLEGPRGSSVDIANPATNLALPATLDRVLNLLASGDRALARVAFSPSALRFFARPVEGASDKLDGALPLGFPLNAAATPTGTVVSGTDLSILESLWTDLGARFAPSLAQRYVDVGGRTWRISWRLDLDALGQLRPAAAARQ